MLGGMRALPDDGWSARRDGSGIAPLSGRWRPGGAVQHGFTHFFLDLHLALYSGSDWASLPPDGGEWWPLDRLGKAGLPTLFAKAARRALAAREEDR
jgi:A/G-specific adenine glycosylase